MPIFTTMMQEGHQNGGRLELLWFPTFIFQCVVTKLKTGYLLLASLLQVLSGPHFSALRDRPWGNLTLHLVFWQQVNILASCIVLFLQSMFSTSVRSVIWFFIYYSDLCLSCHCQPCSLCTSFLSSLRFGVVWPYIPPHSQIETAIPWFSNPYGLDMLNSFIIRNYESRTKFFQTYFFITLIL